MTNLTYKGKDGKKLYGYSQIDLQKLTVAVWVMVALFAVALVAALYVLFIFKKYHILTDIIHRCVC